MMLINPFPGNGFSHIALSALACREPPLQPKNASLDLKSGCAVLSGSLGEAIAAPAAANFIFALPDPAAERALAF